LIDWFLLIGWSVIRSIESGLCCQGTKHSTADQRHQTPRSTFDRQSQILIGRQTNTRDETYKRVNLLSKSRTFLSVV